MIKLFIQKAKIVETIGALPVGFTYFFNLSYQLMFHLFKNVGYGNEPRSLWNRERMYLHFSHRKDNLLQDEDSQGDDFILSHLDVCDGGPHLCARQQDILSKIYTK